jgi:putative membrane protein
MNGITRVRSAAVVGTLVALSTGGALFARAKTNTTGGQISDRSFAKKADQGDLAEVKLAQLAQTKSQSPAVRSFAQRMIQDHSKANDKLKSAASQIHINLPAQPNQEQQTTYDRLSKLDGTAFDRAYAENQVKDHEHVIAEFQKEAKTGQNPQIKQFAENTLPTLHKHLTLARQMYRNVENRTNRGATRTYNHNNRGNGSYNGGATTPR